MIYYKKYDFNSKQEAETNIANLGTFKGEDGEEYSLHNHTVVKLGYLPTVDAVYDNSGNEISPTIHSDKYSVDVLWRDLELDENGETIYPEGWSEKELNGLTDYKHDFVGYTYVT